MAADQPLLVRHEGAIDWLTLNRPDRLNTLTCDLVVQLDDYFRSLATASQTRVVVLQGAGANFCAGLDLKADLPVLRAPPGQCMTFMESFGSLIVRMRRCPQIIVSLIKGAASGGGMALALASDIRIAGNSMRMNTAFARLGLSGMEMGMSYLLPRLIGASRAWDIVLTGRTIDAPEALALGLVANVIADYELPDAARDVSSRMLESTPLALRLTKETLDRGLDAPSLEAAIALENRNQALCFQSGAPREGVRAFKEKRPAKF